MPRYCLVLFAHQRANAPLLPAWLLPLQHRYLSWSPLTKSNWEKPSMMSNSGGAEPLDSLFRPFMLFIWDLDLQSTSGVESDANSAASSVLQEHGAMLARMRCCLLVKASLLLSWCPWRWELVAVGPGKAQEPAMAAGHRLPCKTGWAASACASTGVFWHGAVWLLRRGVVWCFY